MKKETKITFFVLVLCLLLLAGAEILGHLVMTSFGRVDVSNVWIENDNHLMVRGKLFVPKSATGSSPAPGVVYLHGYQNNRETSGPYAVELSRRGIVVLTIDTLGRGNSDNQFSEDEPGFDETSGGLAAFRYLRALPFTDPERCGMGGHSLGGEMSYAAALADPAVSALVFSGFAYDTRADFSTPANMLMIFGKYDEYRDRMTGTRDFQSEWMKSAQTKAAIPAENPAFDTTYGSFSDGTARRVHMTGTTHVGESFDRGALAEAVAWFSGAFGVDSELAPRQQIWKLKEICSLIAMLAAIFSVIPLSLLLLNSAFFSPVSGSPGTAYICSRRDFRRAVTLNGILEILYLPLILVIFGVHVYLVHIDGAFPMMMVNGVVFWFIVINLVGFAFFRRWMKKSSRLRPEVNAVELGLSVSADDPSRNRLHVTRAFTLAAVLFVYLYMLEAGLEGIFLIDFRYKFPYASDLTPFRFLMFLEYFMLFLIGYLQFNIFLQGQLKSEPRSGWLKTSLFNSVRNILIICIPLLIILAVQYIPLLTTGFVPFVGPGGALVGFVINLEHMIVLLIMMIVISTFLYQRTGSIYTGAFVNAMIVSWMFTSSSVIAPLPI